jgi:hypothetical protein
MKSRNRDSTTRKQSSNHGSKENITSEANIASGEQRPQSEKHRYSRFIHNLPPVVTLLKSRRILAALWAASSSSAHDLLRFRPPLFVKRTFGWGSTGAGLIFLASLSLVLRTSHRKGLRQVRSPLASRHRLHPRSPLLVLLRSVTHNSPTDRPPLCAARTSRR